MTAAPKRRTPKTATEAGAATSPSVKNRERTRRKILTAVGRLLARKGSRGLGINAIAREAQVDKVLIYRYFGGLNELYRAFALEGEAFPTLEEIAGGRLADLSGGAAAASASALLLGFGRAVRRRPVLREMMRWELLDRNALTDAVAKERERQSQQWLAMAPDMQGADLPAMAAVLAAGQVFLALRAKTADTYNGIDLHSEEGWKRIEDAVALLSGLFFQYAAGKEPAQRRSGSKTDAVNAGRTTRLQRSRSI